ncbi:MAG: HTH-type transcriptional activator IlvY [Pseudomonadales bacterium]
MDIRSLDLFISLAEQQNFGRAAKQCHLSPSAVSRTIKRLEQELGASLFERDNRRVALTRAGEQFLIYAREASVEWAKVVQSFKRQSSAPEGALNLYCSVTASYSVLAGMLPELRNKHPGIELHVHTGDQAMAVTRVVSGEDDLAIAAHPGQLPAKVEFKTLVQSPLRFIVPRTDCLVRDMLNSDGSRDWSTIPMIVSESGLARERLDAWFMERGESASIYAQVSGHEAIVSLVALGFGIGVVPELVIAGSPLQDQIEIIEDAPILEPFDVGLVTLTRRLEDPLVRAFWQLASHAKYI